MCIQCHNGLSDEMIEKQFSESINNPQYNEWNRTSYSHLVIAMSGVKWKKMS